MRAERHGIRGNAALKSKSSSSIGSSTYHFFLAGIMLPMLIVGLPLIVSGWSLRLFLILLSAYLSGLVIEDLGWYVFNPKVKLMELYSDFSNYYPWIRYKKKKIIPWFYIQGIVLAAVLFYLSYRI